MTMTELLLNVGLTRKNGVSKERIEEEQTRLYQANRALIPIGYARFLEVSNGVQTDALSLFGIEKESDESVRDIYENNTLQGTDTSSDRIFLGDNFREYLVYDWQKKCYAVIDKQVVNSEKFFPFFEHAMLYFLREYIEKV